MTAGSGGRAAGWRWWAGGYPARSAAAPSPPPRPLSGPPGPTVPYRVPYQPVRGGFPVASDRPSACPRDGPPACGYGTPEAMRRAFVKALGASPAEYRRRLPPRRADLGAGQRPSGRGTCSLRTPAACSATPAAAVPSAPRPCRRP
ncbi:hypothetical protein GTY23_09310 [Streptomyces sp. SID5998]|nr:hypothetical protein [Streptomyces sp. SID5998]